jgi:hypothetical protein
MKTSVRNKGAISHAVEIYRQKGAGYILYLCWLQLRLLCRKTFKYHHTFTLGDKKYRYFYHNYNRAWMNERSVEIAVVWDLVRQYPPQKVLEVGNVLSHYFPIRHDVLDKYEVAPGIINKDAADFESSKTYELIVSISTLEHIGWDETLKDSTKVIRAVENLTKCLAKGGMMMSTIPVGYNPNLDKILREKGLKFTKQYCLERVSSDNKWSEDECSEVLRQSYNHPYFSANGLVIGINTK